MNRAWKIYKTNKYRRMFISFSECLKKSWKEEKALMAQVLRNEELAEEHGDLDFGMSLM